MRKTDNRILVEYAGRSLDVLRLSYLLRDLVLQKYRTVQWTEYAKDIFIKSFEVWVGYNEELATYIDALSVNIYLVPDNMDKEAFSRSLGRSLDSMFHMVGKFRVMDLNIVMNAGEDISDNAQHIIEHEMMHLYQYGKSGGNLKTSDLYLNSVISSEKGRDDSMTVNQNDALSVLRGLPYYFDKIEIEANVQMIWHELVRFGDINKCPTYIAYARGVKAFNILKNLYDKDNNKEVPRKMISDTIVDELEIPPSYYFKTVGRGVKKFNVTIGKMIAYFNSQA